MRGHGGAVAGNRDEGIDWTAQEVQSVSSEVGPGPEPELESLIARVVQLEQGLAGLTERVGRLEERVLAIGEQASQSQHRLEAEGRRIDNDVRALSAAVESSRKAVAQTDELVERVVEALESLQSAAPDPREPGAAGVN